MIKNFPASLDSLYDMLTFIKDQAENVGFDDTSTTEIELAAEEALVNIVSYGYLNRTGKIEIGCFNSTENYKGLKIIIKDTGIPYNPLAGVRQREFHSIVEERTPGGYGVFFILKIMDEVEYKREGDSNILILIKYC